MEELPEQFAPREPKPEFDRRQPASLFTYARQKQQWLRDNVNPHTLPEAVGYLANELEGFVTSTFEGKTPEVIVTAAEVMYTKAISGTGSFHTIESDLLPFTGDASVLGAHTLKGQLFGFYQDEESHDLRAYITSPEEPYRYRGGMYWPLYSVAVDSAEIKLAEASTTSILNDIEADIQRRLVPYSDEIKRPVLKIMSLLKSKEMSTKKLHDAMSHIVEIVGHPEVSQQVVDSLLEMMRLELRFDSPHTIHADIYRTPISRGYIPQKGPKIFEGVMAIPDLIGETMQKYLALSFTYEENHEQIPVQIPVQYITSIYETRQE
ncbi:MAG TPA: hypothetical protein VN081_01530 [Dongiaceae bacterium]|nr:hypothetical protein [Dongiaceae bacterium]